MWVYKDHSNLTRMYGVVGHCYQIMFDFVARSSFTNVSFGITFLMWLPGMIIN